MASGCLYLPFIYSFSTKFEIFFDLLIFLSFYFVHLEPYDTMPPFITMLENEYSTLILFSFSTKNRAIGLALLTLVLLFYTPGTERQNKLHPYEDVKSNNFSVCNVFIPYVLSVRACAVASVRVCVHGCVRDCVRACMVLCARARWRARLCACVCVYVRACARTSI